MKRWIKSLFARINRRTHVRPTARKARLGLDRLEGRLVPASILTGRTLVINGTAANDTAIVRYADSDNQIEALFNGQTQQYSTGQIDRIHFAGDAGNDTFTNQTALPSEASGGAGDDQLTGGQSEDRFFGGLGNDTLAGGGGDDVYAFRADTPLGYDSLIEDVGPTGGIDTLDFTKSTAVFVNLMTPAAQAVNANLTILLSNNLAFENLTGGNGDDVLLGNSLANRLEGGPGNDALRGGLGMDTMVFTVLSPSAGPDLGRDDVGDSAGRDTLDFSGSTQPVTVDLADYGEQAVHARARLIIGPGTVIENVLGGSGADRFYGNLEDNTLDGGAGNDVLQGRGGDDALQGRAGNDVLDGGTGDDVLRGHEGIDDLSGGDGDDLLQGGDGDDYLGATAGRQEAGNDRLYGEVGNDVLRGGTGNDNLYGGDGDDVLGALVVEYPPFWLPEVFDPMIRNCRGQGLRFTTTEAPEFRIWFEDGHDYLFGEAGNDSLMGGWGNDLLAGGSGNDELGDFFYRRNDNNRRVLVGEPGDDYLYGGDGNDQLKGGTGSDRLYGDAGDDTLHSGGEYEVGVGIKSRASNEEHEPYDYAVDYLNGGSGEDDYMRNHSWNSSDSRKDRFIQSWEEISWEVAQAILESLRS